MHREIKFKLWDGKRFVDTFDIDQYGTTGRYNMFETYEHIDGVLQQFTGLKDKNGKGIYEGDIIQLKWINSDPADILLEKSQVTFSNGAFYNDDILLSEVSEDCEVIGNIYENPELIN